MGMSFDPTAARASGTVAPPPARVDWLMLATLVASNAASIVWAVRERWPLLLLLVSFWLQSLVIGWYYRKRILALGRFSTDGFAMNDVPAAETPATQRDCAAFLVAHYGFFHAMYALFLVAFGYAGALGDTSGLDLRDALAVLAIGAMFALTQRQEHLRQVETDRGLRPNIGAMLFLPYVRVVPMHVIVLVGAAMGGGTGALVLFGALKTAADAAMLVFEERLVAKSSASNPGPQ